MPILALSLTGALHSKATYHNGGRGSLNRGSSWTTELQLWLTIDDGA
uniref:Uncharacterized protein n=1 Tax=Nelumbo nucifera TaxID=4432 RepID=A0A822YFX1_NELNU|nr:TPA_asm: hypothetical protein HUJ06_031333 [Nelumbo nucifera]